MSHPVCLLCIGKGHVWDFFSAGCLATPQRQQGSELVLLVKGTVWQMSFVKPQLNVLTQLIDELVGGF